MIINGVNCKEYHRGIYVVFCRRLLTSPTPCIGVLKKFISSIKNVIIYLVIIRINETICKGNKCHTCICEYHICSSPGTCLPVACGSLPLYETIDRHGPGKIW